MFYYERCRYRKNFDILPNRQKHYLLYYFSSFNLIARNNVQNIVTDMNVSYPSTMKQLFHKAKIIIDRFHIIQLLIRGLETIRKKVMSRFDKKSEEDRLLKNYYRLLIKDEDKLDYMMYVRRRG